MILGFLTGIMKILFWTLLFLIFYCYLGYPLLISLLSRFMSRPVRKSVILPSVSIIIAAHNEEDVIKAKLDNLFALDYPADKIEILIGSDASVDQTNQILQSYQDPRLRLFIHSERRGKMMTVNDLVLQSRHDIIFFNDARQKLEKNALKNLVQNFADPSVGCASGELLFHKSEGGTAQGVNFYWEYEKFIRYHEARVHSMLGATGAIYAIRKSLYVPAPAEVVLDDMFTPFKIIEKGYRAIFDGTAHAFDSAAHSATEEYRRKARTLYGNYQIFSLFPGLFNPLNSPIAIQLFSHKFLRVMVPFLMIILFPLNFLIIDHGIYKLIFGLQILFYAAAFAGALARGKKYGIFKPISKLCYVPYVFCLLNFAALAGFYRFIGAKQDIAWQKARKQS
jgi:biofilm PGA synthesis N-glycosyltransferase PgaC